MTGKLYLIPTFLGEASAGLIPEANLTVIRRLRSYIAEKEKTARAFLKACETPFSQDELVFFPMDKQSTEDEYVACLQVCLAGEDLGLVSEAGLPCVADPGAKVVNLAHSMGIEVVPLPGMSSILLTLMASGFNGQQFRFVGYLPHDRKDKIHAMGEMERLVAKNETQLFIETPYRNNQLLDDLCRYCHPDTSLCIGVDLTTPSQEIKTRPIREWKQLKPDFNKRPAVFALGKRQ